MNLWIIIPIVMLAIACIACDDTIAFFTCETDPFDEDTEEDGPWNSTGDPIDDANYKRVHEDE